MHVCGERPMSRRSRSNSLPSSSPPSVPSQERWDLLTRMHEQRLQRQQCPIVDQVKEAVLLIKGGMPLGAFLHGVLYQCMSTARFRTLVYSEGEGMQERQRLPFAQLAVCAR